MVSANKGRFRREGTRSLTASLQIKMLVTVLVVVNLVRGRRIVALPANESTRRIAHNASLISICLVSQESTEVPLLVELFILVEINAVFFKLTVLCLLFIQSSLKHLVLRFPCLMVLNSYVRLNPHTNILLLKYIG